MQPKPFVLRYDFEGIPFALQFLASDDFDLDALADICRELQLPSSGKRADLIQRIELFLENNRGDNGYQVVLNNLIRRKKKWFTFKTGQINRRPGCSNPLSLITSEGQEAWYGPVLDPDGNAAVWYIRPHFPTQWEQDGDPPQPVERQIRWLCFARITSSVVSLHWQGFTQSEDINAIEHGSQFPYWNFIPQFFSEFEEQLGEQLETPNFHDLVLYELWDQFRLDDNYQWEDLRIRAESGGVSLSARSAGGDTELDIRGIKHLAQTLSMSAERELHRHGIEVPGQVHMNEALLQTIIREFGAKSYEFSLENNGEQLLKAHIYFGMRQNMPGPDSFPHINCYTGWRSDREQMQFLLNFIETH